MTEFNYDKSGNDTSVWGFYIFFPGGFRSPVWMPSGTLLCGAVDASDWISFLRQY
jgi:hypothetical protein